MELNNIRFYIYRCIDAQSSENESSIEYLHFGKGIRKGELYFGYEENVMFNDRDITQEGVVLLTTGLVYNPERFRKEITVSWSIHQGYLQGRNYIENEQYIYRINRDFTIRKHRSDISSNNASDFISCDIDLFLKQDINVLKAYAMRVGFLNGLIHEKYQTEVSTFYVTKNRRAAQVYSDNPVNPNYYAPIRITTTPEIWSDIMRHTKPLNSSHNKRLLLS